MAPSPVGGGTPAAGAARTSRSRWQAVARRVADRRRELGLSVAAAAARGGVDEATWERVEAAARPGYRRHREEGVCRALGWTPGSIERILAGGEPEPVAARPAKDAPLLLRPLSTRHPDGAARLCPARVAVVAGIVIEGLVVVAYFRV